MPRAFCFYVDNIRILSKILRKNFDESIKCFDDVIDQRRGGGCARAGEADRQHAAAVGERGERQPADLKVAAGQFAVNDCRVGLPAKTVGISRIALTDGDVFLNTAESAPAEKADSAAALPWQIDVGKLTVANLVFGMRTAPAVTDLSVRLPDGGSDVC